MLDDMPCAGWPIGCVRPRVALLSARDGRSGIHGDTALNWYAAGQGVADHTVLLSLFNHALNARRVALCLDVYLTHDALVANRHLAVYAHGAAEIHLARDRHPQVVERNAHRRRHHLDRDFLAARQRREQHVARAGLTVGTAGHGVRSDLPRVLTIGDVRAHGVVKLRRAMDA